MLWKTEIIDKVPIINVFDILAKTAFVENDRDDNSNKMLVLFDNILLFKRTIICNCGMQKQSSSGCLIHAFVLREKAQGSRPA